MREDRGEKRKCYRKRGKKKVLKKRGKRESVTERGEKRKCVTAREISSILEIEN